MQDVRVRGWYVQARFSSVGSGSYQLTGSFGMRPPRRRPGIAKTSNDNRNMTHRLKLRYVLAAGLALQQAGVIKADVDVKKALDDLIDDKYLSATN